MKQVFQYNEIWTSLNAKSEITQLRENRRGNVPISRVNVELAFPQERRISPRGWEPSSRGIGLAPRSRIRRSSFAGWLTKLSKCRLSLLTSSTNAQWKPSEFLNPHRNFTPPTPFCCVSLNVTWLFTQLHFIHAWTHNQIRYFIIRVTEKIANFLSVSQHYFQNHKIKTILFLNGNFLLFSSQVSFRAVQLCRGPD